MITSEQLRALEKGISLLIKKNRGAGIAFIAALEHMQDQLHTEEQSIYVLNGPQLRLNTVINPIIQLRVDKGAIGLIAQAPSFTMKIEYDRDIIEFFFYTGEDVERVSNIEQLLETVSLNCWNVVEEIVCTTRDNITEHLQTLSTLHSSIKCDDVSLVARLEDLITDLHYSCYDHYTTYTGSNYNGDNEEILTYHTLSKRLGLGSYCKRSCPTDIPLWTMVTLDKSSVTWYGCEHTSQDGSVSIRAVIPTLHGNIVLWVEDGVVTVVVPDKVKYVMGLVNGFLPTEILADIILGKYPGDVIVERKRSLALPKSYTSGRG